MWDVPQFQLKNCTVQNIHKEHCIYQHVHGPVVLGLIENNIIRRTGRTACQWVSRVADGEGAGTGYVVIRNNTVTDVAITSSGGGSAFTFAGGMVNVDALVDGNTVTLGGDPTLGPKGSQVVAGCITTRMERFNDRDYDEDEGEEENMPKTWDAENGYGLKSLTLTNNNFDVGSYWPGTQGARQMIELKEVETIVIGAGNRFWKDPQTQNHDVCTIVTDSGETGPSGTFYPGKIGRIYLTDPSNMTSQGRWRFDSNNYGNSDGTSTDGYDLMFAAECDATGGPSGICFPLGDGP
jgi:hypothetical protein